jgi:ribosomal protein S16
VGSGRERERIVGAACLRLRKQRYKVEVGAYGPQIAEASRREIVRRAEALVALLGGVKTADQVLRFLRDAKFYHDGMWLFGEVGLNAR